MKYTLLILKSAQKELSRIPEDIYPQIRDTIRTLSETPRPSDCIKLTGREGWRIRIGNYRVVYEIDDEKKTITILHVGHRRNIYR